MGWKRQPRLKFCWLALASATLPDLALAQSASWRVQATTSEMDDTRIVTLSRASENTLRSWGESLRPTLVLRCRGGEFDAYLVAGTAGAVAGRDLDQTIVRYRLDEEQAVTEWWGQSVSGRTYFVMNAPLFTRNLRGHRLLRVEFTPINGTPEVLRFQLAGLDGQIARHMEGCRDVIDPPPTPAKSVIVDENLNRAFGWIGMTSDSTYYYAKCEAAQALPSTGRRYFNTKAAAEAAGFRRTTVAGC